MKRKKGKLMLSFLLAVCMVCTMMTMPVQAEETAAPGAAGVPAASEDTEEPGGPKQEDAAPSSDSEALGGTTPSSDSESAEETTAPSDGENKEETTLPADGESAEETTASADEETPEETTASDETEPVEETTEAAAEEQREDISALIYQVGGMGQEPIQTFALDVSPQANAAGLAGAKAALKAALSSWSTDKVDISAYGLTVDELRTAYSEVLNENPELFYVSGIYTYWQSSAGTVTLVAPGYSPVYTREHSARYEAALNKAYAEAVPSGTTDPVQIAMACYDYLAQHMEYDTSLTKFNAYNALVEGTAVCQGYSLAYAALLKKAGIPVNYANSVPMNHMWNVVQLGGNWYHVDVTWGDPLADRAGFVNHRYFLNSDAKIGDDTGRHFSWVSPYSCSSTAYDDAFWQQKGISAVFLIGGGQYYLQYPADANTTTIRLMRRDGGGEQELASFDAVWSTMNNSGRYGSYFATLSFYDGMLYVNDAKNIYRINPAAPAMQMIYTYPGTDGHIYGSLVCDGTIRMTIATTPSDIVRREQVPIPVTGPILAVSVSPVASEATYGYTAGPTLTAAVELEAGSETKTPAYQWYKVSADGRQTEISGATGVSYTVETGLNAGTYTYRVSASLDGGKLYSDARVTVKPLAITPTASLTGQTSYVYTGSAITPAVKAEYNGTVLSPADYTVTYSNNINAGTAKAVVAPAKNSNYTWTPVEAAFTINKAPYTGETSVVQTIRYGASGNVDLAAVLADGFQAGTIRTEDPDGILSQPPVLSGTKLSCTLKNEEANTGKMATVTVPVVTAANYEGYEVTVTIVVGKKLPQMNFVFGESVQNKTYGDADFTAAVAAAEEGSQVSYASSDPDVATVDGFGRVHILKAGTATITASATETEDYLAASASYTLNVAPKALSWDVSALYAVDRADSADGKQKTDAAASLYGELKVAGILEADQAQAVFQCPAEFLQGTYENTAAGDRNITLVWKGPDKEPVLTGEKAENYRLPASLPAIAGKINEVNKDVPVPPESTEQLQYRLEVENGISRVPDAFKAIEALRTPAGIISWLKAEIQKRASEIAEGNIEVYDVTLMINVDGQGWVKADRNNFPAGGLTVTLPYPAGTGRDSHDFVVTHLFTEAMNGFEAGSSEFPQVTKTEGGIQFKVNGLSPVSIGWKEAARTDSAPSYQAPAPSSGETTATGDNSPILFYESLIAASVLGIGILIWRRKCEEMEG